jgi:hypothetical protein
VLQAAMQAPVPLQYVRPHSKAGSVFTGMDVQVPTEPARSHAWHVPAHPALQHTPSTHCPLLHSCAALQDEPFAFFAVHVPALQ